MSALDTSALLVVAQDAALRASDLVRSRLPRTLTFKGDRDVVSDVDLAVEELVRNHLRERTPGTEVVGEEGGGYPFRADQPRWVLDPIDGTINFIHGVPLCAVSLSLVHGEQTLVAVVDLPFLGTQYGAVRGGGSHVNGERIDASRTERLDAALVSVDQFAFGDDSTYKNRLRLSLLHSLMPRVQRIRMLGTSAVDLIWTAQGRFDACVILGNKPWDTSAGVLIAREAGARVLDLDGSDHRVDSAATVACAPGLEGELVPLLRAAAADATRTR